MAEAGANNTPKKRRLTQTSMRRYLTCHTRNGVLSSLKESALTPKSIRFRAVRRSNSTAFTKDEPFRCYDDGIDFPATTRRLFDSVSTTTTKRRSSSSAFVLHERDLNENTTNTADRCRSRGDRKRPADSYPSSKLSVITENQRIVGGGLPPNDERATTANACKRRKMAIFFDHEEDKDIPIAARSLHRVHSLSTLEKSPNSPDYIEHYSIRTVERPFCETHNAFGCISSETLCQLLFSFPAERFCNKFFLVDCRYPYEYAGGHIKYAVNLFDIGDVSHVFYPSDPVEFRAINSKIPIFYCEFSQQRGPKMAKELRKLDREKNLHNYPNVDYKEIYVVDQGYRKFYHEVQRKEFYEPYGYVPMMHANHVEELKKFRFHHEKLRKKCNSSRHKTLVEMDDEE